MVVSIHWTGLDFQGSLVYSTRYHHILLHGFKCFTVMSIHSHSHMYMLPLSALPIISHKAHSGIARYFCCLYEVLVWHVKDRGVWKHAPPEKCALKKDSVYCSPKHAACSMQVMWPLRSWAWHHELELASRHKYLGDRSTERCIARPTVLLVHDCVPYCAARNSIPCRKRV